MALFDITAFKAKRISIELPMKSVLKRIEREWSSESTEIMKEIKLGAYWRRYALRIPHVLTSKRPPVHGFGAKQFFQSLKATLAEYTYALKADRLKSVFGFF